MTTKKPARASARASREKIPAALQLGLPVPGSVWKGNAGSFGGILRNEEGTNGYALDVIDPKHWPKAIWGPVARVAGASSEFDGLANTQAMAAAGSEIAKKVLAMKVNGHGGIYIAAPREARLAQINGCGPKEGACWTSRQYRHWDDNAWIQYFDDGAQDTRPKSFRLPVVLVRRRDIQ